MRSNVLLNRLVLQLCGILLALCPLTAQNSVSIEGGTLAPAKHNSKYAIEAYVVHPSNNFTIRIAAPAGSTLMQYTESEADAHPVPGASYQAGNWVMANPLLNATYLIKKSSGLPNYYCLWKYDSKPLPTQAMSAQVAPEAPCERVILTSPNFQTWEAKAPDGSTFQAERLIRIAFTDLTYNEETSRFAPQQKELALPTQQGKIELEAPLADTPFTLLGDNYNQALGINFTPLVSETLIAKRVEIHSHITVPETKPHPADTTQAEGSNPFSRALSAPATVSMEAIANEPTATRYVWRILSGRQITNDAPLLFQDAQRVTQYTFRTAGTFVIYAEVSNADGSCLSQSEPTVVTIATSKLEVPNAFSPTSSPGVNDVFRVVHSSLVKFQGVIFNETGQKLFSWSNPDEGWDGTYNGKHVPAGVYYYVIDAEGADGQKYHRAGHINILDSNQMGVSDGYDTPPL